MKIEINENSKIHAGISLANKRRFYDALCIFAQVESYESALNQIACLCEMEDVAYAIDVYRYAKQKYGLTHALFSDLYAMKGVADTVLNICERDLSLARSTQGKISANPALLLDFQLPEEEDFSTPDFNYSADDGLFYDPKYATNKFYDVKSVEYLDSLRINTERCFLEGDEVQARKYAKRLLAVETDHLPTLEAQISLVLYSEKFKKGIPFAERLAELEGGSHAAIGGAIEILMNTDPAKHVDALQKLLKKAADVVDEINYFDLEDYVYVATEILHDCELASVFAKSLFADFRFADLEALKICAYAFYNVGDLKNARLAAISLLQAVPHDAIAQILLDYLNNADPNDIVVPFEIAPRYVRHEFVPVKFANYAQRKLIALLEAQKDEPKLGKQELLCLSVLAQTCPSLAITQRSKDYYTLATFVRKAVRTFLPQNNQEFFDFCKRQLFDYLPDQSVSEFLLARMLTLGCCDKVFVSARENSYYVLDCSTIAGASEDFYFAFAICATLFKAPNAAKYLAVYNDIVQMVHPQENLFLLTHHFAYALMRICQKGFAKSEVEQAFSEEEKSLYFTYKELKKQKQ